MHSCILNMNTVTIVYMYVCLYGCLSECLSVYRRALILVVKLWVFHIYCMCSICPLAKLNVPHYFVCISVRSFIMHACPTAYSFMYTQMLSSFLLVWNLVNHRCHCYSMCVCVCVQFMICTLEENEKIGSFHIISFGARGYILTVLSKGHNNLWVF